MTEASFREAFEAGIEYVSNYVEQASSVLGIETIQAQATSVVSESCEVAYIGVHSMTRSSDENAYNEMFAECDLYAREVQKSYHNPIDDIEGLAQRYQCYI